MKKLPTLRFERKLWRSGYLVVGVDEVGRGALAGPLVVGAVCFYPYPPLTKIGIDDSKKLSAKKREKLARVIKKRSLTWAIGQVSVGDINRFGIVKATQKAIRKAVKKIIFTYWQRSLAIGKGGGKIFLLIDGFYVKYLNRIRLKNYPEGEQKSVHGQKAIINGDEKSISIAAASIIAKVYRDRLMRRLAKKYPRYHWEKNKGYGTRKHIKALKNYGKTPFHRPLFLRKIVTSPRYLTSEVG